MKLNVYTIFDQAAKAYVSPFFMHNHAMATRTFSDQVNQTGNQINSHPEQFILFCIGEYDDQTGEIIPLSTPESLGKGNEYVDAKRNDEDIKTKLDDIWERITDIKKVVDLNL